MKFSNNNLKYRGSAPPPKYNHGDKIQIIGEHYGEIRRRYYNGYYWEYTVLYRGTFYTVGER